MEQMQKSVLEFHETFGLEIGKEPNTLSGIDAIDRRINLIEEEKEELEEALYEENIEKAVDAIGDLLYVVFGTAVEMGIDIDPIFKEVHRSNMTKKGGYKREDGKWMKPKDYSPTNFKGKIKGFVS
jgi:predicted HAD superfamily Cof-like phosphohydrolase